MRHSHRSAPNLAEQGSQWIDANLFNGEYYIQQIRGIPSDRIASDLVEDMAATNTLKPEFQIGSGCMADQLVGQYMATLAGLGPLLNEDHIRKTLESIYRYNYKQNLNRHASVERVYALNDEAALVICDYTRDDRSESPMSYYAEVWTGVEYAVAALMMANGMTHQGVECIENVRRRYDGEKANPFGETEYGRHYARPMASWAAIPVLSGFQYDGRTQAARDCSEVECRKLPLFLVDSNSLGKFPSGCPEFRSLNQAPVQFKYAN